MGYADDLRAYDGPQSDPGDAVRARLAQALRSEGGAEQPAGPLEGAMGQGRQYFPMLAAASGMQQAPPNGPAQRLLDPFNPPRVRGIGESLAGLLPQFDEKGMYKAPGVGDAINAALWVIPGMKGPRAAMAAEGGGSSLPRLGGLGGATRRARPSLAERQAGIDRMAQEMEAEGAQPQTGGRSAAFDRVAEEMSAAPAADKVDWAAIKVGDKVFKGQTHFGAAEKAAKELGIPFDQVAGLAQDGFLTTSGKFVDRAEAGRIVDTAGQHKSPLPGLRAKELHASEVKFPRTDLQQFFHDLKEP